MNLNGEPATVGRFCGSNTYSVTREAVEFYADALDDPSPIYQEVAPPLLHHSECYNFVGDWYLKNLYGNLHAQQDWELFEPIRIGSSIRSCSTIIERHHKRGRDYVINETDLFDVETGHLLVRGRTHQSFLPASAGAGDESAAPAAQAGQDDTDSPAPSFVVDQATARSKRVHPPFPTATGASLRPFKKVVDERRCWMFSGPGKNYHTDREQALNLGFPNIVVQGMMSTCFVSELMIEAFGAGWITGGKMSLKLTNVLWVDETVTTHGRIREETPEGTLTRIHCDVWAEKDDGTRIALGSASAVRQ